ncbi:hypothetical protein CORC01_05943 [Colletotrichum orchidophilum]|uniref:Uncharacterized protein n=1 Tax=Colletotrichum orchidophilum TaxID=1209926 RepID=A0A1G4BBA0_9PEZI|nr:uncharacterized protein CORC01_05943 [Colletotrichum orchidophilum]OHE98677.1 hypothetical protein CORC01_05943 [Colletotrichum orchidophilum]
MPVNRTTLHRAMIWPRRRTTPPWPSRTCLRDEAKTTVSILLSLCMGASTLATITFANAAAETTGDQALMSGLSIILGLAQWGCAMIFGLHKCIRPPPGQTGNLVLLYPATWVAMQAVCFVAVQYMWQRDWSQVTKNAAVTWMVVSLGTVALWTHVILCLLAKRYLTKRTTRHAARPADPAPAVQMVVRDRIADIEEAVSPVQAPPYVAVREVKNENVRLG